VHSRIYRWYRDLKETEDYVKASDMRDEIRQQLLSQLEPMHGDLIKESISLSYRDALYH
jgi:hypothetical protein